MNFRRHNSASARGARRGAKALLLIAAAAVVFGVNHVTDGAVATAVRTPAASVLSTEGALGEYARELTGFITTRQALIHERDALRARVAELELYAINNMALLYENQELRALFGDASDTRVRGERAAILSRGGEMPYGTVLISRSAASRFGVGAHVYASGGVAIGTVSEVGSGHALVTLFTAPGQETPVILGVAHGDDTIAGTLTGLGSGTMTIAIPRDAAVSVHAPVLLQNTEETTVVGVIGSIEEESVSAFQTLRVRTPVNLHTLRFVEVR